MRLARHDIPDSQRMISGADTSQRIQDTLRQYRCKLNEHYTKDVEAIFAAALPHIYSTTRKDGVK